jgi:hypothetical protein
LNIIKKKFTYLSKASDLLESLLGTRSIGSWSKVIKKIGDLLLKKWSRII